MLTQNCTQICILKSTESCTYPYYLFLNTLKTFADREDHYMKFWKWNVPFYPLYDCKLLNSSGPSFCIFCFMVTQMFPESDKSGQESMVVPWKSHWLDNNICCTIARISSSILMVPFQMSKPLMPRVLWPHHGTTDAGEHSIHDF